MTEEQYKKLLEEQKKVVKHQAFAFLAIGIALFYVFKKLKDIENKIGDGNIGGNKSVDEQSFEKETPMLEQPQPQNVNT